MDNVNAQRSAQTGAANRRGPRILETFELAHSSSSLPSNDPGMRIVASRSIPQAVRAASVRWAADAAAAYSAINLQSDQNIPLDQGGGSEDPNLQLRRRTTAQMKKWSPLLSGGIPMSLQKAFQPWLI